MKKNLLASFAILLSSIAISYSQDTVRIKHTNYVTVYSKSLKYPVLVEWWETKAKVACVTPLPRKDQFAPDPLLPFETDLQKGYDQINKQHKLAGTKGVDRGHMCPAASNECEGAKVLTECFYFSNMAPQFHSLNAGNWKSLETLERQLALQNDSVHVWAGSLGELERVGSVSIPKQCWKVVYVSKTKEYLAYIFDNNSNKPDGLNSHKVDVDYLSKLTGYKFN